MRPNGLDDTAQLHVEIDREKANALGLSIADINSTLNTAWGGVYVNEFVDRGRVKRVYMQGDAPFRMTPEDLDRWYVRTATGTMAPFSSFARPLASAAAELDRYNGVPAVEIQGQPAPGMSSGTAMNEMERADRQLPRGRRLRMDRPILPGAGCRARRRPPSTRLSILVVFLCLAALYESWSIPFVGAARHSAGRDRRRARGDAARSLQRRLFPGRPAHHDRAVGEERDPDRGIRRGGRRSAASTPRGGDRGGARCACGRS